jgi:WD40 repeat protein
MVEVLTCPRGHQWQLSFDEDVDSLSKPVTCPACGTILPLYEAVSRPGNTRLMTPPEGLSQMEPLPDHARDGLSADMPTMLVARVAAPPLPGTINIPGYEILGELGRGGMGVVYQARQRGLNRIVALKMILAAGHAGPKELARFRHEAEVVAQLHHPHVVQIYEVGEADGRPFFSLEFLAGGSLASKLDGTPWAVRPAVQLVAKLAGGIHAAHQLGIVHRDLKPANVLLDADGTPKITDFGLAKKFDSDAAGPTQSGAILGTPSYMAPEQAEGKAHLVGPGADVYALGSILYELLTGRPPFRGETPLDTLMLVRNQDPVPPRRLQPKVPRDLETICLKALTKNPAQRYQTAQEMAEDLDRFLTGASIKARPAGVFERTYKLLRRHPWVVVAVLPVLLLVGGAITAALSNDPVNALIYLIVPVAVSGLGLTVWQWQHAQLQKSRAEEQRHQAEAARHEAEEQRLKADVARRDAEEQARKAAAALAASEANRYFLQIALAEREFMTAHVGRAEEVLESCPALLRHWEWHYLKRLCHAELATFQEHTRPVLAVAFHPHAGQLATAGWDQTILIWDLAAGSVCRRLSGHSAQVTTLAYSPDGRWLASAGGDQNIILWDTVTGEQLVLLQGHQWSILGLAFSPNGRRLASAGGDQVIRLWDAVTGKGYGVLKGHQREVTSVAYSPDGRFLASGSSDQIVRIWDMATGQEAVVLRGHSGAVFSVAFSPNRPLLASAGEDQLVRLWDYTSGQEIHVCRGHSGSVISVAFSPDGRRLASTSWDRTVKLWNPETAQETATLRGHTGIVTGVAFQPDGNRLATASDDKTVKLWNAGTAPDARCLHGHTNGVLTLTFSPDGGLLVSGSGRLVGNSPGEVKVWDLHADREAFPVAAANVGVLGVVCCPDGQQFASAQENGMLTLWSAVTGKEIWSVRGHQRPIVGLACHPDGGSLLTAADDGIVKIWNRATAQEIGGLRSQMGQLLAMAFSPDGRHIALASRDRVKNRSEIKVFDVTTGKEIRHVARTSVLVSGLAFSPSGQLLAVAARDPVVKIWNLEGAKEPQQLRGHTGEVAAVAFSPDGKRLASAGHDHTVKLWDVATGQEILTLRGHTAEVVAVVFSRDGHRLASAGMDQTIRLWDALPLPGAAPDGSSRPSPSSPSAEAGDHDQTRLDPRANGPARRATASARPQPGHR